jgi:hypothetical protein
MHVFEQPKQRANTGFLPYDSCVRVLMGQVVLHAKRSNALLSSETRADSSKKSTPFALLCNSLN